MGEMSKKSAQKPRGFNSINEPSSKITVPLKPQSSVDLKIAEQLKEFDSQHSGKKHDAADVHSRSSMPGTVSSTSGRGIEAGTFDKHFESLRSPSLEDVQESAEEIDSPRKSVDMSRRSDDGTTAKDAGISEEEQAEVEDGKARDNGKEGKDGEEEKVAGEEETTNDAKKDSSVCESTS